MYGSNLTNSKTYYGSLLNKERCPKCFVIICISGKKIAGYISLYTLITDTWRLDGYRYITRTMLSYDVSRR